MIDLLRSYLSILLRMGNRKSTDEYAFKPFHLEKIAPAPSKNKLCRNPLPRSGHRIVCDDTNLYSFGGYNPLVTQYRGQYDDLAVNSFPLFRELWKFNYATKTWKRYGGGESLPTELASNAVIREGNYLMIFGGTGSPFGNRCSNSLYICKLDDETGNIFEVKAAGEEPTPLYGQALVYHNNCLYTIGGTTGFSYNCDIHRLNMKKTVWEKVYVCRGVTDEEPEGRYRHEVAFDGRKIYVLGGGTADEAFDFFYVPVFDVKTGQWAQVRTKRDPRELANPDYVNGMPQPRKCHGAVQVDAQDDIHVFISGGFDGEFVFDDLWRLELSTMQWTFIDYCVFPRPLYFHSASVSPAGKMSVFGGIYGGEDMERSSDIYSIWVCVPRLSEMCWEALLHYNPLISMCPRDKLIDIGLPKRFVHRLE